MRPLLAGCGNGAKEADGPEQDHVADVTAHVHVWFKDASGQQQT
jgi:hypothetical protein